MRDTGNLTKGLAGQLKAAFDAAKPDGMTLVKLIEKSGLDIDESSMSRKLKGGQPIGVPEEAEALGRVFGLRLEWNGRAKTFRYVAKKAA